MRTSRRRRLHELRRGVLDAERSLFNAQLNFTQTQGDDIYVGVVKAESSGRSR